MLNNFLILTYSDLESVLKFFKIKYRNITINNEKVTIEIYKIKWFQFIKKYNLRNCKDLIEENKPLLINIEYKFYK